MLANLHLPELLALRGPLLIDQLGVPRYWASVWLAYQPSGLASSTLDKKLAGIEALYRYSDECFGLGALDDAIATIDTESLSSTLEGFFLTIKNKPPITATSEYRWQSALQFVLGSCSRLDRSSNRWELLSSRLAHFELLNMHLHISKQRRPERVRSLPSDVVKALYEMLDPEAAHNPFRGSNSRWRVWVIFILLLHQGLRRGELLSFPIDVIKSGLDRNMREPRYWMTVRYNEYEDEESDPRYNAPSIKTASSIRQIPVSRTIALLVDEYATSYRGKADHSFLINSQKKTPLSHEGLTWLFGKITSSLPKTLRESLCDHTGSSVVTPHHLRHTCAVFRLNQMLSDGIEMRDALERMRVFFGWSRTSEEPLRYARAVFEDRLAAVWNIKFDDRVEVLRNIPSSLK
jgi:integrase